MRPGASLCGCDCRGFGCVCGGVSAWRWRPTNAKSTTNSTAVGNTCFRPLSFTPQFCFFWRPFTPLQCDHGWTGVCTCLRDFRVVALSVQPMASIQESGVVDGETANEHLAYWGISQQRRLDMQVEYKALTGEGPQVPPARRQDQGWSHL